MSKVEKFWKPCKGLLKQAFLNPLERPGAHAADSSKQTRPCVLKVLVVSRSRGGSLKFPCGVKCRVINAVISSLLRSETSTWPNLDHQSTLNCHSLLKQLFTSFENICYKRGKRNLTKKSEALTLKYTLFDFDNLEYRAFIVTYRIRYCWFYRLERRNFYINSNFPCEKQIVGFLYPLRACLFFFLSHLPSTT